MFGAEKFRVWMRRPILAGKDNDPPDYTPIAQSNAEAARIAKEAADADLAFRKQVYEESKPRYQRLLELADAATRQQMRIADEQEGVAKEQYRYWQERFKPVEEATILDAMGGAYLSPSEIAQLRAYSSAGNVEGAYGLARTAQERAAEQAMLRAGADVNSAFAQQARTLARLGVDPNRMAAYAAQLAGQQTLAQIQAANQARESALGQGLSLRSGVANFGRNMPNTAGQAIGVALQAGTNAVGNQRGAFESGVTYPQYVSGAVGNQINAQQLRVQGNNALISAMSNDYRAQREGGLDIGGLLSGGAALFKVLKG